MIPSFPRFQVFKYYHIPSKLHQSRGDAAAARCAIAVGWSVVTILGISRSKALGSDGEGTGAEVPNRFRGDCTLSKFGLVDWLVGWSIWVGWMLKIQVWCDVFFLKDQACFLRMCCLFSLICPGRKMT